MTEQYKRLDMTKAKTLQDWLERQKGYTPMLWTGISNVPFTIEGVNTLKCRAKKLAGNKSVLLGAVPSILDRDVSFHVQQLARDMQGKYEAVKQLALHIAMILETRDRLEEKQQDD